MIEGKFDIVFSGKIVPGKDLEQVQKGMAKLFKTGEQQIQRLFTGKSITIKKQLDYAQAMKYQSALKSVGALVLLKKHESSPGASTQTARSQSEVTDTTQSGPDSSDEVTSSDDSAKKHSTVHSKSSRQPQNSDSGEGGWTVANAGEKLPPSEKPAPIPEPDLSALDLDSSNAPLENPKSIPEPELDLSGLTLDEPGLIQEPKATEKKEVDTSQLSIAEAGEKIPNKPEKKQPVNPDTSHLDIEK